MRVRATCIDSGGHHAERVYAFARARRNRRVFATKGAGGARPIWPKRASKGGVKGAESVFIVGVDTAKDAVYGRLRIKQPGPGYIHFPAEEAFDDAYFEQLTSESVVTRYREGRPYRVWVLPKGKRNEALDTFVLALAALKALPFRLDRYTAPSDLSDGDTTPAQPVVVQRPPIANAGYDAPEPGAAPHRGQRPRPRQSAWLGQKGGWLR
jgi:phage terminase large subunit GpA-like protein